MQRGPKGKHSILLKSYVWSIITFPQKFQYIILIFKDWKNVGVVVANISPFLLLDSWVSVKISRPLSFSSDKVAFVFPLLHERKSLTFPFSILLLCYSRMTPVIQAWPQRLVACPWWYARSEAVVGGYKARVQKEQSLEKGREPRGPEPPRFRLPLWFLELLFLGFLGRLHILIELVWPVFPAQL